MDDLPSWNKKLPKAHFGFTGAPLTIETVDIGDNGSIKVLEIFSHLGGQNL